jgi:hypothetical protein
MDNIRLEVIAPLISLYCQRHVHLSCVRLVFSWLTLIRCSFMSPPLGGVIDQVRHSVRKESANRFLDYGFYIIGDVFNVNQ